MKNKLEQKVNELEQKLNSGFKELQEIKVRFGKSKYAGLKVGDGFELIGKKWKILDSNGNGVFCLCMNSLGDKMFDSKFNEWTSSNLRDYLNTDVYKKIIDEIGEENVIEFERNLLSLDGQSEYGTCKDFVSLISIDECRKYRSVIPNFEEWWWTLTPYSTKCNDDTKWITVVSPSGDFDCGIFSFQGGVRPVCIFSSTLFESEDE